MHNGKRLARSLKSRDETEARRNLIKIRNNLMGRIDRGELDKPTSDNFTVGELFESYLTYLRDDRKKSLKVNECVIDKIPSRPEFLPDRKVATLTTDDFNAYRKREVADGIKHRTINYRFTLMRAALRLRSEVYAVPCCQGSSHPHREG